MVYNNKDNSKNSNKGFTLVELIVVLVILAILAAVLVPALLGYIDRAKNQQYVVECRDIMEAAQAGIVEAYAKNKPSFERSTRPPKTGLDIQGVEKYGFFTSGWVYTTMKGKQIDYSSTDDKNGGYAKVIICNQIAKYLEKTNYNLSDNEIKNATEVSALGGKQAFLICYSDRGAIIFMQYSKNGMLVTFDGKSYSVEKGGKFVSFRN